MDPEEKRRLRQNWRGRRLLACRAAADLCAVIEMLGTENDPSILPPDGGAPPTPSEAAIAELVNLSTVLLRQILIANDGHVSPRKLQTF